MYQNHLTGAVVFALQGDGARNSTYNALTQAGETERDVHIAQDQGGPTGGLRAG